MCKDGALRYNSDKPKLGYFARSFHKAQECLARVMAFGDTKYPEGNWKKGGKPDEEYLDSAARHLDRFLQGEHYDQDSACHHLGHAIWNLAAILEMNYKDLPMIDEAMYKERMAYWANKKDEAQKKEVSKGEDTILERRYIDAPGGFWV